MKLFRSLLPSLLLAGAGVAQAASSWGFSEATLLIGTEGRGSKPGYQEKLSDRLPLPRPIAFRPNEKLKIFLAATEDGKPKRPHQAFLTVKDQDTGLESSFPFTMRDNGRGLLEITQNDLPLQFVQSSKLLQATLVIASFGTSQAFSNHVVDLELLVDADAAGPNIEKPLRYSKLPEINHIFKEDAKSGPVIISIFFTLLVLASVPILLVSWLYLGANFDHFQRSISTAPISQTVFFGSILAMEGLFFLYYYSWTLFQMLPVAGVIGLTAFVSGSKALSEVQARREANLR